MPIAILSIKPVEVSLRLVPISSGTPMMAKVKQASENACLEVTALDNLALSLVEIS